MNIAQSLDGKYITVKEVKELGGKWEENGAVFVFPDMSIGRFTDIRDGAQEQTRAGEPILHFVGGDMHPDADEQGEYA